MGWEAWKRSQGDASRGFLQGEGFPEKGKDLLRDPLGGSRDPSDGLQRRVLTGNLRKFYA